MKGSHTKTLSLETKAWMESERWKKIGGGPWQRERIKRKRGKEIGGETEEYHFAGSCLAQRKTGRLGRVVRLPGK